MFKQKTDKEWDVEYFGTQNGALDEAGKGSTGDSTQECPRSLAWGRLQLSWFDEDELELVKEIDGETALKLFKLDLVKELEIDKQNISAFK